MKSIGVTLLLLLFATGCNNQNAPETFVSDKARPTWTIPSEYDITSSMTAVVKVDLKAQYPDKAADFVLNDEDLLAAFYGETCLGVAQPQEGLFHLYISVPVNDTPSHVTLKYYSAYYKNFFEAKDAIVYKNDEHPGTPAEPLAPAFVVVK